MLTKLVGCFGTVLFQKHKQLGVLEQHARLDNRDVRVGLCHQVQFLQQRLPHFVNNLFPSDKKTHRWTCSLYANLESVEFRQRLQERGRRGFLVSVCFCLANLLVQLAQVREKRFIHFSLEQIPNREC